MKRALNFCRKAIDIHTHFLFFLIVVCFLLGMVFVIGLDHPSWGDEGHFVNTISYFGKNLSLRTISDYDQVTGPIVFIVYALWGKIIGFKIAYLRVLSLLFSGLTLLFIYRLFALILQNQKVALFAVCLLLINPYMWGLSFFVFTDIPTLCFLVLFVWAVYRQQPLFLFFTATIALLARQYSVYLVVAVGIYQLISLIRGDKSQILNMSALVMGCMPLIILMYIWGGAAPPSGMKRWVVADEQIYHYDYITTYISFIAAYLSPIIIIMRRQLFKNKAILLICFLFSGWYLFFPIRPSLAILAQTEHVTVGLLHRMIKYLIDVSMLETVLLWGLFWCGLVVLANIVHHDFKRFRNGAWDYSHFLTIAVLCFLLIMPFSYQVWEKYLVNMLPIIMLRLMIMKYTSNILNRNQDKLNKQKASFGSLSKSIYRDRDTTHR